MPRFGPQRRALLLTVLVPGLGHVYLRQWRRGALWAGIHLLALVVFSPFAGGGSVSIFGLLDGGGSPLGAAFPLSIVGLCLLDVYARVRVGNGANGRESPT